MNWLFVASRDRSVGLYLLMGHIDHLVSTSVLNRGLTETEHFVALLLYRMRDENISVWICCRCSIEDTSFPVLVRLHGNISFWRLNSSCCIVFVLEACQKYSLQSLCPESPLISKTDPRLCPACCSLPVKDDSYV